MDITTHRITNARVTYTLDEVDGTEGVTIRISDPETYEEILALFFTEAARVISFRNIMMEAGLGAIKIEEEGLEAAAEALGLTIESLDEMDEDDFDAELQAFLEEE